MEQEHNSNTSLEFRGRERTQRSRVSTSSHKTFNFNIANNKIELAPKVVVPYDPTFKLCQYFNEKLLNKGYKPQPGLGGFTFPKYFQYSYYRPCRNVSDFDFAVEEIKNLLVTWNFHLSALTNLYRHSDHPNIFIYVKKYNAPRKHGDAPPLLAIYVLKYYNGAVPVSGDLR